METNVYNQIGKQAGSINLPEKIFGLPWNEELVYQVVTSMQSNARRATAHVKDRGEVRGGGKKPWKQKGTGRARHGSRRSPIWRGGGVTHGPTNERNYERKINKKTKAKALYTILSQKLRDNRILFLDAINFKEPKTKEAKKVIADISSISGFAEIQTKKRNSAFVAIPAKDTSVEKSFANFNNLNIDELRNINPLSLLKYKYLVLVNPEKSLETLTSKLESK